MLMKRLAAGLCALAMLAPPVLAQTCEPAKLAAAIDIYASEPFSARTWRVLNGYGDPHVDFGTIGGDEWANTERWQSIAKEIAPEAEDLLDVSWQCRIAYPLSVLDKRIGSLGKNHLYVKQWLMAQEAVMQACGSEGGDDIVLPPPAEIEPSFINLQKLDRAYQEASIAFYRNRKRAVGLFRVIAGSKSPHRAAARYNIANLLANMKQPEEARKEAEAILADPSLGSVHAITRELVGYIANQEDTAQGWTDLIGRNVAIIETPAAGILASDDAKRDYARALYDIDFMGVRAQRDDWWLDGKLPENPTISKALVDGSRQHPMVLWMMAGQSANDDYQAAPWSLIGSKWQSFMTGYIAKALAIQPSGLALKPPALDMLKALSAIPDDATRARYWSAAQSAIAAAEKSCGTAPETAAAGFLLKHAVRLAAMSGKYEEALAVLDKVPFKTARAYWATVNDLAYYMMGQGDVAAARQLRDRLIVTAPPVIDENEGNVYSSVLSWMAEDQKLWLDAVKMKDDPAADIMFNFLPSKTLWSFAADPGFDESDRALFARAAWTRDYALGRKIAPERTEQLFTLNPPMREIAAKVEADYPKAGPERRRLLTILRSPRYNILVAGPTEWGPESLQLENYTDTDSWDRNDKNWWCPLEPDRQLGALRMQADAALGTGIPDYGMKTVANVYDPELREAIDMNRDKLLKQHPMVKAISWKEVTALAKMPSAPRKLTEASIRWGKASAGDDGAPEALALAVNATRRGCNWHGSHATYSKAAHQLLQRRFTATTWAEATPIWWGCQREERDADGIMVAKCEPKTWPKQPPLR